MSRHTRDKDIENCVTVWLEENLARDESGECFNRYQRLALEAQVFNEPNECIDYITNTHHQRVFFILSASMASILLPLDLHLLPQIHSIYVLSLNEEKWATQIPKVKGIFMDLKLLYKKLRQDFHQLERDLISFDLLSTDDCSNNQEATFMYAQLIKEIFLEMNEDNIEEILDLLRTSYINNNPSQLALLDEFDRDYSEEKAITWYSRDSPLYRMVNRAIRIQDTITLYKMRTFIKHLHNQLAKLYHIQKENRMITLYRGQRMSNVEFQHVKNNIGGLISIKNFLSTTINRDLAFIFAGESNEDEMAVLMEIEIDHSDEEPTSYFANIEQLSYFGLGEQEWLFSMGSVFRVSNIERMENNHVWLVQMKLTDRYDKQLKILTQHLGWEIQRGIAKPLFSFAKLLFYMGNYKEAKIYLHMTLDLQIDLKERLAILHSIATIDTYLGTYSSALDIFHQVLELQSQQTQDKDDPIFADTYSGMGMLYVKMGELDQALEYLLRSLHLMSSDTDYSNQLSMIKLYINIGAVYLEKNQLDEALENYQRALESAIKNLPPIHPSIAIIYNNISQIYYRQGRYQDAVDINIKSFKLKQASLSPDHPSLAIAYKNLADIYELITRYEDALLLCQQALGIELKQLSSDHPSIADTYDRIGSIYCRQGRKEDALDLYQKSLNIRIASLPADHYDIGISYNNLCTIFCDMKRLDEGLDCSHKALTIYQHNLPSTHPLITKLYINMGGLYDAQKNYTEALYMYQNALDIQLISLPTNHPDLSITYHNMSCTLRSMGRLDEALDNGNKAVDISTRALGSEHGQTKLIQYYLQLTKDSML